MGTGSQTPPLEDTVFYRKVKHLLRPDFFVLNIGANNGVDNDPIFPLLEHFPNWRGIFVEPDTKNFHALRQNYASFPNVKLEQAAIAATSGKRKFYSIDERSGCDMHYVSQISSFSREYVKAGLENLRSLPSIPDDVVTDNAEDFIVEHAEVNCLSFADLLEKHAVRRVDFLNIDTEGADFEIFSTIDFRRIRPAILCIENQGFTADQQAVFDKAMLENNYRYVMNFCVFSNLYVQKATPARRLIGKVKRALGLRPGRKRAATAR